MTQVLSIGVARPHAGIRASGSAMKKIETDAGTKHRWLERANGEKEL